MVGACVCLVWLTPDRRTHGDFLFHVRVTGKLVDSESGRALPGVWVLTLPKRSWVDGQERVAQYRRRLAEEQERARRSAVAETSSILERAWFHAAGETAADGSFDVVILVDWAVSYANGVRRSPTHPPPRHGVQALLVEVDGRDRRVIDLAPDCGTWTEHPDDPNEFHELWATWDLGTLEVRTTD
jgi:hypothetical protein